MSGPVDAVRQGDPASVPVFSGGGRLLAASLVVGGVGLIATAVGFFVDTRQALFSYLVAFMFVLALALGGLGWLLTFHAAQARWPVVLRRLMEVIAASLPLLLVAFVPLALGMKQLFVWVDPAAAGVRGHLLHLVHHKHGYLNVPFFLVRAALYFGSWLLVSELQLAWSRRQEALLPAADVGPAATLTRKQRFLAAGSLPLLGLGITFASVDWIMSLSPEWFSTMFGAYYIAGALSTGMAVLVLVTLVADRAGLLGDVVRPSHWHSLGKLMFAFVCFWAYIAFSQFMLIYVGHLPEEIGWFIVRNRTSWRGAGLFLVAAHFAVPFVILLSRGIKTRPRALGWVAAWILLSGYVDVHWMVMPTLHPKALTLHWLDLTALLGLLGVTVAFTVWRARGRRLVAVRDPYVCESARYDAP